MAGPLAGRIVEALASRYPDACRDALDDVRSSLARAEANIGVVPTQIMALARDYLVYDEQEHRGLYQKSSEQGVRLYDDHGGRVGDGT